MIPNGTYVKHSTKPIRGGVVGVTRIKKLFERADDAFEYRIQTLHGDIKICSESNVIPQVPDPPNNSLDRSGGGVNARMKDEGGRMNGFAPPGQL